VHLLDARSHLARISVCLGRKLPDGCEHRQARALLPLAPGLGLGVADDVETGLIQERAVVGDLLRPGGRR
jgi:hypothetical protein